MRCHAKSLEAIAELFYISTLKSSINKRNICKINFVVLLCAFFLALVTFYYTLNTVLK